MLFLVTNIYKNIPTDEKIKLYLRFCDYIAKEQIEDESDKCKPEAGGNSQQAAEV